MKILHYFFSALIVFIVCFLSVEKSSGAVSSGDKAWEEFNKVYSGLEKQTEDRRKELLEDQEKKLESYSGSYSHFRGEEDIYSDFYNFSNYDVPRRNSPSYYSPYNSSCNYSPWNYSYERRSPMSLRYSNRRGLSWGVDPISLLCGDLFPVGLNFRF